MMGVRNTSILQKYRVPLGFIFGAVFLVFASPTPWLLATGLVIALLGLVLRAWSAGHIRKNQELAVSGPYAFTRNPLYLGSFLMGAGFTFASGVWWLGLLFVVLFLGIYFPVMRIEAAELTAIFGREYKEYAEKVPLLFPWAYRLQSKDKRFELELYLRYREYRAALGFLAVSALLIIKTYIY